MIQKYIVTPEIPACSIMVAGMKHSWFEDYFVFGQDHSTKRPWFNSDVPCRGSLECASRCVCQQFMDLCHGQNLPEVNFCRASWRRRSTVWIHLMILILIFQYGSNYIVIPSVCLFAMLRCLRARCNTWACSTDIMGRRQTTCNGLQASQLSCRSLEKLFSDVLSETQLTLLCWACACLCSHGPTSISRWSLLSHISWLEDMEVPICLLGVRALVKECPRLRLAQKLKVWPARLSKR